MLRSTSLSTRLTVAIVALVVVTAATVGFLTYRNIASIAVPRTLLRSDAHVRELAIDLSGIVTSTRADVLALRHIIGLDEIIALGTDGAPETGLTLDQWRARIAQRLIAELDAKPNYAQLRIVGIADGGREVIRVARGSTNGVVRVVPGAELQRQGDRDYFMRTVATRDGDVVVSQVDLNLENGVIESPPLPVVRLSTPIFARNGQLFGMIVVNVDLRPAFAQIGRATQPGTSIYVVNERGDYLAHPDHSRAFGFASGTPFRIQDDFPGLGKRS